MLLNLFGLLRRARTTIATAVAKLLIARRHYHREMQLLQIDRVDWLGDINRCIARYYAAKERDAFKFRDALMGFPASEYVGHPEEE